MKKLYFLTAIIAVMFAFNANAQKKMAYITTVPIATTGATANDTLFVKAFQAAGFTVDLINAAAALPALSDYDVLVLSAVPASGGTGLTALQDSCLKKPFVNMKTFQLQSNRWNWGTPVNSQGNNTWCTAGDDTLVTVVPAAANHPVFNGIQFSGGSQNQIVLSRHANATNSVVSFNPTLADLEIIPLTYAGATTTLPSYFEIPVGQTIKGVRLQYKQVVLGLSESSYGTVTADALKMAVNAAKYVLTPGNFVKQWQLERWSAATVANLTADTLLPAKTWYVAAGEFTEGVPRRFKNNITLPATPLTANSIEIAETSGMLFWAATKDNLTLRTNWGDNGVQLGSSNKTFKVTGLQQGQFVTVSLKSSNANARGISAVSSNLSGATGTATYSTGQVVECQYEVTADGDGTFTYNEGIILKSILITKSPAVTVEVANPAVSIAHNTATNVKTVTITCETAGAEIYYTTDGSNPTKASSRYTVPFELTAKSFSIRSRAWVGESFSPGFGDKAWADPLSFDPTKEFYIFSHGADEASGGQSKMTKGLYLYAVSATDVRWKDSTDVDFASNVYKWKIENAGDGFFKFKNANNNAYAAKGSIGYINADGVDATVASLVLNATGDAFFIKEQASRTTDNARPWTAHHYTIQFSTDDAHGFEVNNGNKEKTDTEAYIATNGSNPLANTVQINNTVADTRARFLWIISTVPGGLTGVNNPNYSKIIKSEQYFDVMGRQVTEFTANVVVIKKITYTDGTTSSQKLLILK